MDHEAEVSELKQRIAELERQNGILEAKLGEQLSLQSKAEFLGERYKSIIENSIVGIIQTSIDGRLLMANPAAVKMFGSRTQAEMLNLASNIEESLYAHKEQRQEVLAALMSKGRLNNFEFEVKTKSGNVRWVLVNSVLVRDDAGQPLLVESTFVDVTEKQRALEALSRSEAQYRSLFENSVVGILQNTVEGKVILANKAVAEMYGVETPELLYRVENVWEELCADPAEAFIIAEELFLRGRVENYQLEGRKNDGSTIWVTGNSILVKDGEGNPQYIESTFVDNTARHRAQEALKESERKYRELFDRAFEGIFQTTMDGKYLSVNPAMAQIFGYDSPEDMINSTFDISAQMYARPEDRELILRMLREGGSFENQEGEASRRDGSRFWVLASARMLCDEDGKPYAIEGSCIDITDRKTTEAKLKKSEDKYAKVFQFSPFAITITNLETGRLIEANQAMVDLLGYKTEEMVGHTALELGLYLQPEMRARILESLLTQGQLSGVETKVRHKDGSILTVNLSLSLIELDGIKCYLNIADDITERTALREQLLAVQKMDAVGQLAGGVAHDFNNLLTVILGYGEDLAAQLAPDSHLQSTAREILKAGMRAAQLTQQLLTLGSKQVIKPQVLDVNILVRDLYNMLSRMMGNKIEFDLLLDAEPCLVKADAGQLEMIILNLVVNSRDAMPSGGRLALRTNCLESVSKNSGYPSYVKSGEYIVLEVTDTGSGMDKYTLDRLFEPFFTTKKSGGGVGLGMPSVYGAVKQSKGFILVNSEPGIGTEVRILLPKTAESVSPDTRASLGDDLKGHGEHILVVEDEEALGKMVIRTLETLDFKVSGETSASTAMALIEAGLRPDLIVCDVDMPRMSGRELAERIWEIIPEQKILFMSGYTEDEIIRQGIIEKDFAYISKPFSVKEIVRHINRILGNKA